MLHIYMILCPPFTVTEKQKIPDMDRSAFNLNKTDSEITRVLVQKEQPTRNQNLK